MQDGAMTHAPALAKGYPSPGWAGKARYLALLVPLFGLVELGAHFYFARRAPKAQEWTAVRPAVAAWYKSGDVVVVAPYWAEPMARLAFGDELMPLRDVARPDVTRYREAIEVSILGRRAPELEGWKVARQERQGKFTLRALENPSPVNVLFDFTDHIEPQVASVRVEKKTGSVECAFTPSAAMESGGLGGAPVYPSARFACPGEPTYVFVGVTIIDDEQSRPRRCIWSHPPGTDAELVTRFRDVPLGTQIHGHAGAGWLLERDHAVPSFTIKVMVGGQEVGNVVHNPGDAWKAFDVALAASVGQRTADVEFRVAAPGGGTHVCFEADSR
jgi:hypothetical protein